MEMLMTINHHYPKQKRLGSAAQPYQGWTPASDPFYYGYRTVAQTQPDGSTHYQDLPLTQADFLDPQPGDRFTSSTVHTNIVYSLVTRFYAHYAGHPNEDWIGVFSKMKLCWGIPGEKEPMPDLMIVTDLKLPQHYRKTFSVQVEGTRPCLIVEVMSPFFPWDDTVKVDLYQRMGIAEYIIINPQAEEEGIATLVGYSLVEGAYHPIQPDPQGRLLSRTTDLWFALNQAKNNVILTNAITGKQLLTTDESYTALTEKREVQKRLYAERQRAEAAEAEVARLRSLMASQG
jgi:hypothetical protein